jgi:GNAT superfamily N-acetyltransferase
VHALHIEPGPADHVDVLVMVAEVQAEYARRYGTPDEAPVDVAEFTPPEGAFFVGYVGAEPAVSGAWRCVEVPEGMHAASAAEVKRMYVRPRFQRRGLARVMLAHLEEDIRAAGHDVALLGTGIRQPEAIALYESCGYQRIAGFGYYGGSEENRSFAKSLLVPRQLLGADRADSAV